MGPTSMTMGSSSAEASTMRPAFLTAELSSGEESLTIAYREQLPPDACRGVILLIHGFPQTSYQFRHVMPLFAGSGYRCIAPDYRGAGASSKAVSDFRKVTMAADMIALLDHLEIHEPVHVLGHDIGGMIAYVMASRHPQRVKDVCWGECPLPGSKCYQQDRTDHAVQQFHFIFHSVLDLPESLIAGKERIYISHFFSKLAHNLEAISEKDIDFYERAYSQPGAMRCAFGLYRAFQEDARANRRFIEEFGLCQVPTLILNGAYSRHKDGALEMAAETTGPLVEDGVISHAGHYIAEENPEEFAKAVADFIER